MLASHSDRSSTVLCGSGDEPAVKVDHRRVIGGVGDRGSWLPARRPRHAGHTPRVKPVGERRGGVVALCWIVEVVGVRWVEPVLLTAQTGSFRAPDHLLDSRGQRCS